MDHVTDPFLFKNHSEKQKKLLEASLSKASEEESHVVKFEIASRLIKVALPSL